MGLIKKKKKERKKERKKTQFSRDRGFKISNDRK
jgi:hypothetical protein